MNFPRRTPEPARQRCFDSCSSVLSGRRWFWDWSRGRCAQRRACPRLISVASPGQCGIGNSKERLFWFLEVLGGQRVKGVGKTVNLTPALSSQEREKRSPSFLRNIQPLDLSDCRWKNQNARWLFPLLEEGMITGFISTTCPAAV